MLDRVTEYHISVESLQREMMVHEGYRAHNKLLQIETDCRVQLFGPIACKRPCGREVEARHGPKHDHVGREDKARRAMQRIQRRKMMN